MDKKSIYIIVAIAIIAVGIWFWLNQPVSNAPVGETLAPVGVTSPQGSAVMGGDITGGAVTEADNTASINQNLNNITVEDPDFKSIDSDLNSL